MTTKEIITALLLASLVYILLVIVLSLDVILGY